jgi:hypothetical protein
MSSAEAQRRSEDLTSCGFMRHQGDVFPVFPAHSFPESPAVIIACQHEHMAPMNAMITQNRETFFNEPTGNTALSTFRHNSQVMKEAAPTVVSAKDGSNEPITVPCRKAKPWVS